MSEDMTTDRDGLAAEYVLGTLDVDERGAARALLGQDAEFATKVKLWERRLGELHLMVDPVEPRSDLWPRIKAKLPEPPPRPQPQTQEVEIGGAEAGGEPKLQPEIDLEPVPPPHSLPLAGETRAGKPATEAKPEPERNHEEVARKTAAEVNFESAIATVESALASHGAAAAAKSEAALAPQQSSEPATAPPVDETARPAVSVAPASEQDFPIVVPARPGLDSEEKLRVANRHLAGWRALALLMILLVLAMAALVGLWKFAPERLPAALEPTALMRLVGIEVAAAPPARKPLPPESQYDE
jgi:hypothetical protein